jgi:site-specific DNA-methyltransferase (adenine-specific)
MDTLPAEPSNTSDDYDRWLKVDEIYLGDCRRHLPKIEPASIALSVWSPPYWVGKSYEIDLSWEEWKALIRETIALHTPVLRPGAFLVINIADILCFRDSAMPRIQLANVARWRSTVTKQTVLEARARHPEMKRDQLAALLGCSEQTIDRRINGNNARGGKYEIQTRVKIVGGLLERWGLESGLYLYDRRVWVKDPAWANCQWHSSSYRAVDEFEYVYIFWKPGETVVDRRRLDAREWSAWGSRAVWHIPSVRANDEHEAQYPLELPLRLIRLLSDPEDTVLDCFAGSGTTAVACVRTSRHFIACELLPKYVELARRNIQRAKAEALQINLF